MPGKYFETGHSFPHSLQLVYKHFTSSVTNKIIVAGHTEKLIVYQLVTFPSFCGIQWIISRVTRTCHWALSLTRCKSLTFSKLISYESWEFGFSCWWLWRILCSGMWCCLVWYKCAYVLKDRNCSKLSILQCVNIIRRWSLQPTLILSPHLYLGLLSDFFSSGCRLEFCMQFIHHL